MDMKDFTRRDVVDWLVISESGLEQTMLRRIAERAGATRIACIRPRGENEARLHLDPEAAPFILASLGEGCLKDGTLARIERAFPLSPIVVILRDHVIRSELGDLPRNVNALLWYDVDEHQIQQAIDLVCQGYRLLPSGVFCQDGVRPVMPVVPAAAGPPPPDPASASAGASIVPPARDSRPDLTEREWQVCVEIQRGMSNKEISRRLGIAVNTVNAHVGSSLRKLGVQNRTQIALLLSNFEAQKAGSRPHL